MPQPSNPPLVTLDIRNPQYPPGTGWKTVQASNNTTYSYNYAGGSDGHGNSTVKGRGVVTVTVNLICDQRYQISTVGFNNDPNNQLSNPSKSARAATILDQNNAIESDAYFSITVTDTTANCTLVCDPMISNTSR